MADCSAAGTALDRVARAAAGGGSGGNTKQVLTNLLGHGTLAAGSSSSSSRPDAPPTRLPAQAPLQLQAAVAGNINGGMEQVWAAPPSVQQQQQQHPTTLLHHHPATATAATTMEHHHPAVMTTHPAMMQQQQHHHHHAAMMMHHQQQQQMMMMQQMNLWMKQQQEIATSTAVVTEEQKPVAVSPYETSTQRQQQQVVEEEEDVESQYPPQYTLEEDDVHTWHEGLEEEFLQQHEQGASMEELAAAWEQAEAEYYEDAVNLASAAATLNAENHDDNDATVLYPYEFSAATEAEEKEATATTATRDWMKEGMECFERGRMARAIQCFETEVRDVHPDHAKAWHMLGKCHAENDQDRKAIACLERSVERDPYNPEALLALGVSYVNELNPARALRSLKAWITHNPKYAGLELDEDVYGGSSSAESEFDQVQRLLLRALEFGEDDHGDIHEALGVVYNVSRDYAAAVEAFRKALVARGDNDYSLHNKLGATLANSNQSQEALPAYHRALQIKPKYARAWLNMAISHSNLQNYDEAARCYLQTLSLNPEAVHCWSYLRIALSCSEQWDLIPLAAAQDLKAFREHYDFVIDDDSDATY